MANFPDIGVARKYLISGWALARALMDAPDCLSLRRPGHSGGLQQVLD
jgi:hypothetical protein